MRIKNTFILLIFFTIYLFFNFQYTFNGIVAFRDIALLMPFLVVFVIKIRSDELVLIVGGILLAGLFILKLIIYKEFYLTGFMPISIILVGIMLRRITEDYSIILAILISIIVIILSIWIIFKKYSTGLSFTELDLVYFSRNTITTLIISLLAISFVSFMQSARPLKIRLLEYITVISAIALTAHLGRTGILSAIFLLFVLIITLKKQYPNFKVLLVFFIIPSGVFFIYNLINSESLLNVPLGLSRLMERGTESPRWQIWSTVLSEIGSFKSFFGLEDDLSIQLTGFGWHNGYIHAYSMYGILGIVLLLIFIVTCQVRSTFYSIEVGILIFALLVRAIFDTHLINPYLGSALIMTWLLSKSRINDSYKLKSNNIIKDE